MSKTALQDVMSIADSLSTQSKPAMDDEDLKVDPFFIEDPMATSMVERAIKSADRGEGKPLLLWGPPGCGKSHLARNVHARLGKNMKAFDCSAETTVDDLIGKPWKEERNGLAVTVPVYGAATLAMQEGCTLLIEEIDHAQADILTALHRIMDTAVKTVPVYIGRYESIKKAPGFNVIATANTICSGEDTFLYAGTKVLNIAFMSRFKMTVEMSYLPEAEELKVLMNKTGIKKPVAQQMVSVALEARKAREDNGLDRIASVLSTRELLEWASLVVDGFAFELSADIAFLNRWPKQDKAIVKEFVKNRA